MADKVRKRKRGTEESKDLSIFEWDIANFKEAFEKASDGGYWISPVFVGKSVDLPNSFWHIQVSSEVIDGESGKQKHLALYLNFIKELNAHNTVMKAKAEYSLLDKSEKVVLNRGSGNANEYGAKAKAKAIWSWGFSKMATITQLTDPNNHFLDDNVLRIRIKVWIQNEETNASAPKIKKPDTDQLHKNLNQLLESSLCSNVTIVAEDSTLKAHKGILSCRSPVFAAMFQSDMSESLTCTIKIEDFSIKTIKGMLEFIYSENVESVEEDFVELLKIAEKYELEELKVASTKAAILKLSVDNAIELLVLGDTHNAPELKYRAMAFINSNKANPMFSLKNENAAFEQFVKEHPKLVFEMYKNVRNNDVDVHHSGKSSETIYEVTKFVTDLND